MPSFLDDGPLDPDVELDQARQAYHFFKSRILEALDALHSDNLSEENAKSAVQASKAYQQALLHFTKQEVDLEKHRKEIRGIVQADELDLEVARDEILARLARYRVRS